MSDLAFKKYIRRPFKIEAIQVSEENIEALNEIIGTGIEEKGGVKQINVNHAVVPTGWKVKVGGFVTRMVTDSGHVNYRVYPEESFLRQFLLLTETWEQWFAAQESDEPRAQPEELHPAIDAAQPQKDDKDWEPADPLKDLAGMD